MLRYVLELSSMLSSVVGLKQFAQVFRGAEAVYTGMKWRQCCILRYEVDLKQCALLFSGAEAVCSLMYWS